MSQEMITARLIDIFDGQITSSTVPFPDTGETILTATSYAVGDTASYLMPDGVYHKVECKSAVTVNFSTAATLPEPWPDDDDNSYWIDLGYVNKLAPFQRDRNTQNDAASPYVVDINPGGRVTVIGINNVLADSVTVENYNASATLLKTQTVQLLTRKVSSWKDWLFQQATQRKKYIFIGLPIASTNTFKLTFTRAAGNVKVGNIVCGISHEIGIAQLKGKVRNENYTVFNADEFGETKIVKRRNIPELDFTLAQKKGRVNSINSLITNDLNGEITLWAGTTDTSDDYFENLMLIGMCMEYNYTMDSKDYAMADIEIRGM